MTVSFKNRDKGLRLEVSFVIIQSKSSLKEFVEMSLWNTLKQKLRSILPVSRTYMDNKLQELEKENKELKARIEVLEKENKVLRDIVEKQKEEYKS